MSNLRIEFYSITLLHAQLVQAALRNATPNSVVTLPVTTTPTISGSQPTVIAGISAVNFIADTAPVFVSIGYLPDPSESSGFLVMPGMPVLVSVNAGYKISAVLASAFAPVQNGALDTTVSAIGTSLGTDGTSAPSLPGGATGVRGWLRYVASLLPRLGVAGTPSVDVLSVQGVVNGTPIATTIPVGTGVEASTTTQSIVGLNLLTTMAATSRLGWWFCQNQSDNQLIVAIDDGAGNAISVFVLDPPSAVLAGGCVGSGSTGPHTGRIRVYGPSGSQHSLRVQ